MKIAYCSDLHLECFQQDFHSTKMVDIKKYMPETPKHPDIRNNVGADLLLLAGDIVPFSQFLEIKFHDDFFILAAKEYKNVVWIPGNHEWWGSLLKQDVITKVQDKLSSLGIDNVHLVECGQHTFDGVTILAATLWTSLNKNCPVVCHEVMFGMNDYGKIKTDAFGGVSSIIPEDTYNKFVQHHKFIEDTLSDMVSDSPKTPIVVMTHHTPSVNSIPEKYRARFSSMNYAYFSDLEYMACINPNLKYWVHGHCHDEVDYDMLGARVVSNPHGYYPHESKHRRFEMKVFEV